MDPRTVQVYERDAERWTARRGPSPRALRRVGDLLRALPNGARVADLGCGPGWYAASIQRRGKHPIALDVSANMLRTTEARAPGIQLVRASLDALPLGRGSLDAAVAFNAYQHLTPAALPVALAHLHHAVRPGGPVDLTIGDLEGHDAYPDVGSEGVWCERQTSGDFADRLFSFYERGRLKRLLSGAGFEHIQIARGRRSRFWLWVRARRADTLPDYVRPDLRLLICGLNPSLRSAKTGIPYGRPGNRFWPAACAAGLCPRERDPWGALGAGLGFTDFVKRPTRAASELAPDEYVRGLERVESCVRFFRPRAVCFVGLEGWRRAVDRRATPGWIEGGFAGRPAYLMPSTSGLNAHQKPGDFRRHLREASRG